MVEQAYTYPMPARVTVLRFLVALLSRTAIVCGLLSLIILAVMLAVEENALGLDTSITQGLDAYARMFMGVVALGGGFGVAILLALVHDVYRREQRRALDRIVEDASVPLEGIPVDWQRKALEESRMGTIILSGFGAVLGPILVITAVIMFLDDPDDTVTWGTLGVGVLMAWLGFRGLRSALRAVPSPAQVHWKDQRPPRHPLEPPRRYDSDGNPETIGKRELTRTIRATTTLALAPPALQRLARLDRVAGTTMTVSMTLLVIVAHLVALLVMVRQPCRTCDQRTYGPGTETLIDQALLVSTVLLALGLVVLVVATAVEAMVTLRLRRTIIGMAGDPISSPPPWYLLRRLLLEDAPLQELTGHLHTIAIASLGIGLTGSLTSHHFPMSEWTTAFRLLITMGGVLLLFHASAWFWQRERTRAENHALLQRWQD